MRVLIVAPNIRVPGTSGGSTHVTELAAALARQHDVLVLGRHGSHGPGVVGVRWVDPPFVLSRVWPLAYLPGVLSHATRFRPDVIYERNSALGLGVLLGQALDRPVVSMILDRQVATRTWQGADAFITTLRSLVPPERHAVTHEVRWGANLQRFHPGVDGSSVGARYGFDGDFVVGYCGGFYPWHGLETLVDAARLLAPKLPSLRVLLVGDGRCRARIEARIDALGLGPVFRSAGRVPYEEVPAYVAACDVCVAPYDPAGHPGLAAHGMFFDPLKVFEYLAAGRPAITLDSPNLRRLFEHERHLLLVPPGHAESLAEAIARLAGDRALRDRLGRAGRALMEERYSWQAHEQQLTALFAELVERRRLRPGDR
jgi:glycosyltransferase involved in cell wall biosynthesis